MTTPAVIETSRNGNARGDVDELVELARYVVPGRHAATPQPQQKACESPISRPAPAGARTSWSVNSNEMVMRL